ncbi:MAG: 8-oxo-dGTP diphosphatase [Patescibacteria group bacterium]|nr:8-oxo-dGTP diphosphatase [Patescibacteria group bacterium]
MKLGTNVYVRKDGKTLMLFRNKKQNDFHQGKWVPIGGKLENHESPEECAIRELKEETGLIAKNVKFKGILTFPADIESIDGGEWMLFVFVINDFSGRLINTYEGELKWIEESKLKEINMWPGDQLSLNWLEQPKFFSAKFIYRNGEFKEHTVNFY